MMKDVFVVSDNIISPLGTTSGENFHALTAGRSGIQEHRRPNISAQPFYASLLEDHLPASLKPGKGSFTRFEQLLLLSITDALQYSGVNIQSPETIVILSSTKGNIFLLEDATQQGGQETGLFASARKIAAYWKLANLPLIVSNACISGLTALLTGKRLLETGRYRHAVVAGADIISKFILSGFQSFQAISPEPCRPFDAHRKGINLGEAAATIILSTEKMESGIQLSGGAITNDANHISGPSRSGQELCIAISKAMQQAGVTAKDIGFISAHGTATLYNDEMEAKAFSLAGMEAIPLNSLKGYYGHTLGAAGIVESVISLHSMQQNKIIPTLGFRQTGVSQPVTICRELMTRNNPHCLKTASGFGGCNAALVFSKTSR